MGRPTNLHAVWDSGILEGAHIGDERAYALPLAKAITPDESERWRVGPAATWATESYSLARQLIYGEWPHGPGALPADYEDAALLVVNVQIEKAGVRLASLLNAALK